MNDDSPIKQTSEVLKTSEVFYLLIAAAST